MAAGVADNSVMPRPIRMGAASGSEARPPQTPAQRPATRAPRPTFPDQAQHGRVHRVDPFETAAFPRSAARAYWVEIVGADGEEIGLVRDLFGQHGGGGRLDHHAEGAPARSRPQLGADLVQHDADGAVIRKISDHRAP